MPGYHSRADARIVLVNGKKFDPSPMEADILASTALLRDVLIFGNGRDYAGILLFPASHELSSHELVDAAWPAVDRVNSAAPRHARISRPMLHVVPASAHGGKEALEKSSKGTILRRKAEERYAHVIEAAYQGAPTGLPGSKPVEDESLPLVVLDCFCRVLGRQINTQQDVFKQGVDSMACMQAWKLIEATCLAEQRLPANII